MIVVSILMAFGIDAWWDDQQQRESERVALRGLQTDFAGYLERLAEVRASNLDRIEAGEALMASTGVLPVQVDEPELQALLGRVLVFHTILLQPGSLGALMEADGAALIMNRDLRDQLADSILQSIRAELEPGGN